MKSPHINKINHSTEPNTFRSFLSELCVSVVIFEIGNRTGPISIPLIIPNMAFAISIPAPMFQKEENYYTEQSFIMKIIKMISNRVNKRTFWSMLNICDF